MTDIGAAELFSLPALGAEITEATVVRWLKEPGESFTEGEPLLEVAADKVDAEIPAPASGTLIEILAESDAVVEAGAALARVALATERSPRTEDVTAVALRVAPPTMEPQPALRASAGALSRAQAGPLSPAIPGAGSQPGHDVSGGRSTGQASRRAGPAAAWRPGEPSTARTADRSLTRVEKLPAIRKTIARRMMESLARSAQLTTVVEADVTSIAALRVEHGSNFERHAGARLSFLPFFAKAAIEALSGHPVVNASLDDDMSQVTYHRDVHLGMAVDSDKGLMVPVIRRATHLSVAELALSIARVAAAVRANTIKPDELSGGTFTITNTGSRGALFDTPIINAPQSAILGTGAVVERVVPTSGRGGPLQFGVRSRVYLALSYDHRLIDGADAAGFLATVKGRLEAGFAAEELF
ncbi:dihydrolipoamide acetyltransferase component of pyruvate dehydrogenase complex [Mycobacterium saskatchewanense]|uniref:Dihydrolipoamide acetyltransferase component of pyruvate dehydrogenase complex n=1 Tax=Mycobacterium saskatchewanense TaxID=220927 RepID=A0AAJ3NTK5_9MYCO|nr:2-oxo acid dehydrogenase subunit E2 [Mycobacterium saskatchewanense]ORW73740.1 hypothetical protein AWC23_06385 [Mycobacterium saskatchewanense]BBX65167.1 dihydrolipoamide acetyltransferase component of pyruvate dehydrogenase complex [Mycobacterium saskatchewanense]